MEPAAAAIEPAACQEARRPALAIAALIWSLPPRSKSPPARRPAAIEPAALYNEPAAARSENYFDA
jgi:hypothetical protein